MLETIPGSLAVDTIEDVSKVEKALKELHNVKNRLD